MRKLTQKEANERVSNRCDENNYTLIKPFIYVNNLTKIHLKCNKDNHLWYPSYNNFVSNNHNCSKCSNVYRPTQQEIDKKVLDICNKKNYTLVTPFVYKNSMSKLHLKCNKDGYEWTPKYNNFMINSGCAKCNGNNKITQQEAETNVLNKCESCDYELINPFIYVGNTQTIFYLKCNKDENIWESTYSSFISYNFGCKKCSNRYKPTQQEAETNVLNKCNKKNYTLLNDFNYKNSKTLIHLKCNNDNYEWFVQYKEFINNDSTCFICSRKTKYTQDEINNNVLDRCKLMNYKLIEPFIYKNNKTRIYLMCDKGHIWNPTYTSFVNTKRNCSVCKKSLGEISISKILTDNKILYIEQHKFNNCKNINSLVFDFYLPNYNTCIEYDGEQHYKSIKYFGGDKRFELQQQTDLIKTNYCIDNNIKLLRISYLTFDTIEKDLINMIGIK